MTCKILSPGVSCFSFPKHPLFPDPQLCLVPSDHHWVKDSAFLFLIFIQCRQNLQVIKTVSILETGNQRSFYMESRGKGAREQSQTLKRTKKKTVCSQLISINNILNQHSMHGVSSHSHGPNSGLPLNLYCDIEKVNSGFWVSSFLVCGKKRGRGPIPHKVVED